MTITSPTTGREQPGTDDTAKWQNSPMKGGTNDAGPSAAAAGGDPQQ